MIERPNFYCFNHPSNLFFKFYILFISQCRARQIAKSHLPGDLNSKNSPVGLPKDGFR